VETIIFMVVTIGSKGGSH